MKRLLLTSFDGGGKLALGARRHVVIAGSEAKKRQKSRKKSFFLSKDFFINEVNSTIKASQSSTNLKKFALFSHFICICQKKVLPLHPN